MEIKIDVLERSIAKKEEPYRTLLTRMIFEGDVEAVKEIDPNSDFLDIRLKTRHFFVGKELLGIVAAQGHLDLIGKLLEKQESGQYKFLWDRVSEEGASRPKFPRQYQFSRMLIEASKHGHIDIVLKILERDASNQLIHPFVLFDNEDIYRALRGAAKAGHLDVVKYIIEESGIEIDCNLYFVEEGIEGAAENGHLATVQYLKQYVKSDIKKDKKRHAELLVGAAKLGNVETIEELLREVDGKFKYPCVLKKAIKALEKAAEYGHLDVVNKLLSKNDYNEYLYLDADTQSQLEDIKHKAIKHMLIGPSKNGHLDIIHRLCDEFMPKDPMHDGIYYSGYSISNFNTPIEKAASKGQLEVVQEFLAKVNGRFKYPKTFRDEKYALNYALRNASMKGHIDVVRELLKKDDSGQFVYPIKLDAMSNALENAAARGHIAIMEKFLEEDACRSGLFPDEAIRDAFLAVCYNAARCLKKVPVDMLNITKFFLQENSVNHELKWDVLNEKTLVYVCKFATGNVDVAAALLHHKEVFSRVFIMDDIIRAVGHCCGSSDKKRAKEQFNSNLAVFIEEYIGNIKQSIDKYGVHESDIHGMRRIEHAYCVLEYLISQKPDHEGIEVLLSLPNVRAKAIDYGLVSADLLLQAESEEPCRHSDANVTQQDRTNKEAPAEEVYTPGFFQQFREELDGVMRLNVAPNVEQQRPSGEGSSSAPASGPR